MAEGRAAKGDGRGGEGDGRDDQQDGQMDGADREDRARHRDGDEHAGRGLRIGPFLRARVGEAAPHTTAPGLTLSRWGELVVGEDRLHRRLHQD